MRPGLLLVAAAGLTLWLECRAPGPVSPVHGRVSHVVICWLKDPGNEEARAELVQVSRGFADIPGYSDLFQEGIEE